MITSSWYFLLHCFFLADIQETMTACLFRLYPVFSVYCSIITKGRPGRVSTPVLRPFISWLIVIHLSSAIYQTTQSQVLCLSFYRATRLVMASLAAVKIPPIFRYHIKATGNKMTGIAITRAITICHSIFKVSPVLCYVNYFPIGLLPRQSFSPGFPDSSVNTADIDIPDVSCREEDDGYSDDEGDN